MTTPRDPMSGVSWREPLDYPYLLMFIVTPVLTIASVVSVAGIFLIPFWWGYLSEWKPSSCGHDQTTGDAILIAIVYVLTVVVTLYPVLWVLAAMS